MSDARLSDLRDFHHLLGELAARTGGPFSLAEADRLRRCPPWGVYFFMEAGETRSNSGDRPRIVRVGTHGLTPGSRTPLRKRLGQHRGRARSPGGNHRTSIFRLLVGTALMARDNRAVDSWGDRSARAAAVREGERRLEEAVSRTIRAMAVLCLPVPDAPGPGSLRGHVERNAIALLSNHGRPALDPPAPGWLGHHCDRARVRRSGLWNATHVDATHDPEFLGIMEQLVKATALTA